MINALEQIDELTIVRFSDGDYGIRGAKFGRYVYLDLTVAPKGTNFWWKREDGFFKDSTTANILLVKDTLVRYIRECNYKYDMSAAAKENTDTELSIDEVDMKIAEIKLSGAHYAQTS